MRRSVLSCLLVLLSLAAAWTPATAQDNASPASTIPSFNGVSLAGSPVQLPGDLHGGLGILVLGFSKGSRDGVTAWGRRLQTLYASSTSVRFYEMAMLADVPRLVRGVVERTLRDSMPPAAQARFLPLTDHEAAWRKVTHYGKPDDPYVLLVDGQGRVLWQAEGDASNQAYTALQQQVEQRSAAPPPSARP